MSSSSSTNDLRVDSKLNKFQEGSELKKLNLNLLPRYITDNLNKFNEWIENE